MFVREDNHSFLTTLTLESKANIFYADFVCFFRCSSVCSSMLFHNWSLHMLNCIFSLWLKGIVDSDMKMYINMYICKLMQLSMIESLITRIVKFCLFQQVSCMYISLHVIWMKCWCMRHELVYIVVLLLLVMMEK